MPVNLTETSTWVATVSGVANGDSLDTVNLTSAETSLAKRTKYLRDYLPEANTVTAYYLPMAAGNAATATAWTFLSVAGQPWWVQQDVAGARAVSFDVPSNTPITITGVTARVTGVGHAGLPATLPAVTLYELDPTTGNATSIGSQTDTSATFGAYDTAHAITLTVSKLVNTAKTYVVVFTGETGANSAATGLRLYGISLAWTAPASV